MLSYPLSSTLILQCFFASGSCHLSSLLFVGYRFPLNFFSTANTKILSYHFFLPFSPVCLFLKTENKSKLFFFLDFFMVYYWQCFVQLGNLLFVYFEVYPKVKVRTQDQEEDDEIFSPLPDEKGAQLFVKIIDSPDQSHYSPGNVSVLVQTYIS